MFWLFWAAHFVGDYPLQPSWLVRAKRHLPGLSLHVLVHLLLLLGFTYPNWSDAWPYLLFITAAHFLIDSFKNFLSNRRPSWFAGPYVLDQLLHLGSLLLAADWMSTFTGQSAWENNQGWPGYLIGYLVPTYVWFISERIIFIKDEAYLAEVERQKWPRIFARVGFVTLFVVSGRTLLSLLPLAAIVIHWPYQSQPFRRRMLLIDLGVTLAGAVFILLASSR